MTITPIQRFIEDISSAFFSGDVEVERKTAEATNVEQLQSLYQYLANGDLNSFVSELHENVQFVNVGPEEFPFVKEALGPEEVGKALAYNFSLVEEQEPIVEAVIAQGEMVAVFGNEKGIFRETGLTYETHWVQQFTFKNRKLIKFRQVLDSATFMRAAGILT